MLRQRWELPRTLAQMTLETSLLFIHRCSRRFVELRGFTTATAFREAEYAPVTPALLTRGSVLSNGAFGYKSVDNANWNSVKSCPSKRLDKLNEQSAGPPHVSTPCKGDLKETS